MATDYYGVLGVDSNASTDQIKRAYRKLARELHPDVNPDEQAKQRFSEVTTAYEVLSDPEKRRVVDLGGDPLGNGGGGGDPFGGAGFGLGDIMDAFFGGGGGGAAGRGRGPRSRSQAGSDALLRMELTLQECLSGVSRELTVDTAIVCETCRGSGCRAGTSPKRCVTCSGSGEISSVQRSFLGQVMTSRPCPECRGFGEVIPDPCQSCSGEGRVRSRRQVEVKVPAGVGEGMRVRLPGEGEVGPGGGPAGDLYVEIDEVQHETFTRDGSDLHCTVMVPMTAAALGTSMQLETLDSDEHITVEPGTQPASTLKLGARGMPKLRSDGQTTGRGDLYVHLDIQTPTRLDDEQSDLLRRLADMRGEDSPQLNGSRSSHGLFARLRESLGGR